MDNPDCIISNVASGDEVICKVSSTNFLTQICKQKKTTCFLNIQALKLHSVLWQKTNAPSHRNYNNKKLFIYGGISFLTEICVNIKLLQF